MKIQILPDYGYSPLTTDLPKPGKTYILEDAQTGSAAQGKAFHALVSCYYISGMWSYAGSGYDHGATLAEFRELIKRRLGAGFEAYFYASIDLDGKIRAHKVKTREAVPAHIRNDPRANEMIFGRLKSWTDYTKTERGETITKLIAEMRLVGVNSKKFDDIISGMEERS